METKKYKLSEISLNVTDGEHGTVKDDNNGNYFLLSCKNIKNGLINITSSERKINKESFYKIQKRIKLEKNDVLITTVGTIGEMAIIEDENINYCFQRSVGIIKPNKEFVNPYFLYYSLRNESGQIATLIKGAVQKCLFINDMKIIEVSLPDLKTQNKIVKVFQSIDKKIKLNNEINNNLYEEAVALYKDKFKGIGQGKKTIGDYIVPKRGKNLLTRDAIDGDTPVVAGGIAPSAYHNQFNTKSPVITISASGANAGYTNLWNIPVWASDCSYIDDSITKNVYFWYIVLKTRQNEIFDAQTGSAQPHIYPQHIAEMSIGELSIAEVEKYNNLVAPLFKMIGENQKENKKLSQLRDTLLPKLMDGEIDLDNIEI